MTGRSIPGRHRLLSAFGQGAAGFFLVAATALLAAAPVQAAQGSCSGQTSHDFVGGATTFQSSIYGARADIDQYQPDLCNTSSGYAVSASEAWAMVTADDKSNSSGTPHPVHYAQSGIVRWGNSSPTEFHGFHTFAQWTRGCNPNCTGRGGNIVTMLGPDPSGVATYSAFLRSSTQTIVMKVGSQIVGETGYNPADVWDSRWQAEYFGEVYHHESDLMGKDSNRLKVTNIQRYESDGSINFVANLNYDNGTAKYCSGGNVNCPRFHIEDFAPGAGGLGMKLWTDPI